MDRTLHYISWPSGKANFGDYLGAYLYQRITGKIPVRCNNKGPCWVTIGSILRPDLPPDAEVWGSGIMTRNGNFSRPRKIYAVRGPLTYQRCKELGYECPAIFGDPALLLPRFYTPKPLKRRYKLGLVFHHRERPPPVNDPDILTIGLIQQNGNNLHTEQIIDKLAACDLIYSSSLHGLIVAHAYGIPALWCQFYEPIGTETTKFLDYYYSLGLTGVREPVILTGKSFTQPLSFQQPNFPIETNALWASCPFRPTIFKRTRS